MKSWKTTLGGVISQLPVLWSQISSLFDGNAATNPDWAILMGSLAIIWALFQARDNNISSEEVGIK